MRHHINYLAKYDIWIQWLSFLVYTFLSDGRMAVVLLLQALVREVCYGIFLFTV